MLKELIDLKKSGASGIKLEFESEFYSEKSALELAELVHRVDLDLCVKLGGASSIQDLHICKRLCANSIVAPMVESAYAVEKFLTCVKQVYGKGYPELLINIETKNSFENLDEILSKCDKKISGFVLGRSDLKNSLGIENPNDDEILKYCQKLSEICQKEGKKLIIGGKIDTKSIDFMNKIPHLNCVETRKVIFEKEALNEENVKKALIFELKCLEAKKTHYKEDLARIDFIAKSLNNNEKD